MNTKLSSRKKPTIQELAHELTVLRSFVLGLAGRDHEGNYRSDFATKVLAASKELAIGRFSTPQEFLQCLTQRQ